MEVFKLALVAFLAASLWFSALSQTTPSGGQSGDGDEGTDRPRQEEGLVISTVDSKPKGKAIKLELNTATLLPLQDHQVQKWRLSCPETLPDENLKLVFLLLHADFEAGDFLQFNKLRYEGYTSTPTVIDFDLSRETLLVSHVNQEGKSDFDLRYVCPYAYFQDCKAFHNCTAIVDYVAENPQAYEGLAELCYNPFVVLNGGFQHDRVLCEIVKRAATCDLVPRPVPSCD